MPQAVNVVPAQLLRDQGARSMEDALRNVPGVAMSHGDGQRDQVVIRGFTAIADQFVDGVRDDALYFRDLADIERIEVLKGPAAVLYGRGSSGGLINRITKKPQFGETSGEASVGVGSYAWRRATADLNVGISDTAAFRLNAAVEDSDSYRDQQFVKRHNRAIARPQARAANRPAAAIHPRPRQAPDGLWHPGPERPPGERGGWHLLRLQQRRAGRHHHQRHAVVHRHAQPPVQRRLVRAQRHPRLRLRTDRYNTLPSGTTDPVTMTVGRSRAFILRDEKGVFNQTDVTWRNQLAGSSKSG